MQPHSEPGWFTEVHHRELSVPCSYWLLTSHVTGEQHSYWLTTVNFTRVHQGSPVFNQKVNCQVHQYHLNSQTINIMPVRT